jgi:hypothetical protein
MVMDAILLGLCFVLMLGSLWSVRLFRRARQAARLLQAERERVCRSSATTFPSVDPHDSSMTA